MYLICRHNERKHQDRKKKLNSQNVQSTDQPYSSPKQMCDINYVCDKI